MSIIIKRISNNVEPYVSLNTNYVTEKDCWEILDKLASSDDNKRRLLYGISEGVDGTRMSCGDCEISLAFAKNVVWDLMKHQAKRAKKTITQDQKDRIRGIIDE